MVLPPVTLLCKISFRLAHWNRISEVAGFMYILHGNLECGMEDLWSKASELNCFFVCLMARPYTLQEFHHAFLSMLLGTWTRFLLQYGALGSSAGSQSAIFWQLACDFGRLHIEDRIVQTPQMLQLPMHGIVRSFAVTLLW